MITLRALSVRELGLIGKVLIMLVWTVKRISKLFNPTFGIFDRVITDNTSPLFRLRDYVGFIVKYRKYP